MPCRASFVAAFALACLPQLDVRLRLAVLLWALVTALSRAAMGRHYLGDVLAGLAVGVLNLTILTLVRPYVRWSGRRGDAVPPGKHTHGRGCALQRPALSSTHRARCLQGRFSLSGAWVDQQTTDGLYSTLLESTRPLLAR